MKNSLLNRQRPVLPRVSLQARSWGCGRLQAGGRSGCHLPVSTRLSRAGAAPGGVCHHLRGRVLRLHRRLLTLGTGSKWDEDPMCLSPPAPQQGAPRHLALPGRSITHRLYSSRAAAHHGGVWAGTRHLCPPADHCWGRRALRAGCPRGCSRSFICILGGVVPAGAQRMKQGFREVSLSLR